jgi:hypothetical protein
VAARATCVASAIRRRRSSSIFTPAPRAGPPPASPR